MKTWQMIKELTENPGKKFTYNSGRTYLIMEDGMIVWKGEHQRGQEFAIGYVDKREREWEEVKVPITFMEVLKKVENYSLTLITLDYRDNYKKTGLGYAQCTLDFILDDLSRSHHSNDIANILLEGEWYVED